MPHPAIAITTTCRRLESEHIEVNFFISPAYSSLERFSLSWNNVTVFTAANAEKSLEGAARSSENNFDPFLSRYLFADLTEFRAKTRTGLKTIFVEFLKIS